MHVRVQETTEKNRWRYVSIVAHGTVCFLELGQYTGAFEMKKVLTQAD